MAHTQSQTPDPGPQPMQFQAMMLELCEAGTTLYGVPAPMLDMHPTFFKINAVFDTSQVLVVVLDADTRKALYSVVIQAVYLGPFKIVHEHTIDTLVATCPDDVRAGLDALLERTP